MKKITITFLTLFMLILTACGASGGTKAGSVTLTDTYQNALPVPMQLIIGTFKLEGTPQAVTASEASQLIPLWQVYKGLTSSDAAAQQEIAALIAQIQGTMTPEQIKAIADMKLTRQDMFTTLQQQGITFGRGQGGPNASGTETPRGNFPGGGFPGGPGGVPGQGPGGQFNPQQIATAEAAGQQAGGGFDRVPSGLIDAFIKFLQSRAGS